jgi:serine/threonine protein kinase
MEDLAKSQLYTLQGLPPGDIMRTASGSSGGLSSVTLPINSIIDQKYRIISLLGEGGMGAVYKAHHLMLNKEVALKICLSPNLTEDTWKRFQREAQALAKLSDKNIVHVFDFGVADDNVPYYTMECLSGESLAERLASRGPLSIDQTIRLFLQVCQGLAVAHSKGIIHRDLKPANIFLAREASAPASTETVKIVDFGLAGLATGSADSQRLTAAGTVFGSPLYMSPEQSLGEDLTERSDIYSCGCALFATLTGSPPYRGENAFATMLKHQQGRVPQLDEMAPGRHFPPALNALINRMLAKNVSDRVRSIQDVSALLQNILADQANSRPVLQGQPYSWDLSPGVAPVSSHLGKTWPIGRDPSQSAQSDAGAEIDENHAAKANSNKIVATAIVCLVLVAFAIPTLVGLGSHKPTLRLNEATSAAASQPPPKDSPPAAQTANISPYLKNPGAVASEDRRFEFPKDSLGVLNCKFSDKQNYPGEVEVKGGAAGQTDGKEAGPQAAGLVTVPARAFLKLTAGKELSKHPELFTGFGSKDLDELVLGNKHYWNNKTLHFIGLMGGVRVLRLTGLDITDDCIEDLNKISRLEWLFVDGTELTAPALTKLKRLRDLVYLSAPEVLHMSEVLEKMKNSTCTAYLDLQNCDINNNDMKAIGTILTMQNLLIGRNKSITDEGLSSIASFKELKQLEIHGTGVSHACIATLKKLPKLRTLKIDRGVLSAADRAQLKDKHVDVIESK